MDYFPTLDSMYHTVDDHLSDCGGIAGTRFDAFEQELLLLCAVLGNYDENTCLVSFRLDGVNKYAPVEEVSRMLWNRAVNGISYSENTVSPTVFVSKLGENTRERMSLYLESRVGGLLFNPKPSAKTLSIQCPGDFDHTPYGTVVQVGLETFFLTRMGGDRFWISSTGKRYNIFEFFDFLVKKATFNEPFHCLYTDQETS